MVKIEKGLLLSNLPVCRGLQGMSRSPWKIYLERALFPKIKNILCSCRKRTFLPQRAEWGLGVLSSWTEPVVKWRGLLVQSVVERCLVSITFPLAPWHHLDTCRLSLLVHIYFCVCIFYFSTVKMCGAENFGWCWPDSNSNVSRIC